jgi:pimeloyl-ACP methyl ester carboxylesterase
MPERFHRIVVGGVGANLFRADDPEPMARAVEGSAETEDPLGRAFARFAADGANDPKALAACLRRPTRPMSAEELGRVRCPVLVVLGTADFAGPADPLMDALPDARLVTLPGVDHLGTPMHMRFIDAALGFLEAVPGA